MRAPVAGACKTRLVPLLGDEGALAAHLELVAHVLTQTRRVSARRVIWSSAEHSLVDRLAENEDCEVRIQPEGDLGARMNAAFTTHLQEGADAVCVVGVDVPGIDADYVRDGFEALAHHDVVIGPVEDGGYGLLGLKVANPALFEDMPWSTEEVAEKTRDRLRTQRLSWLELPMLWDVDEPEDWLRFRNLLP